MKIREAALFRGAMIIKYGSVAAFAEVAGLSVSHTNRIMRGATPLTPERRAQWFDMLNIMYRENGAVVLVAFPARVKVRGDRRKPGPGGLGTV